MVLNAMYEYGWDTYVCSFMFWERALNNKLKNQISSAPLKISIYIYKFEITIIKYVWLGDFLFLMGEDFV